MKNASRKFLFFVFVLLMLPVAHGQDWTQWALNARHDLSDSRVSGRVPKNILENILYDPLVPDIAAANFGTLPAHYQVPLIEGKDVYMQFNGGTFNLDTFTTETFGENKFKWVGNHLVPVWSFQSDWVPPGNYNDFWEPYFQPALANGFIYVPGAGGTIIKLNKLTGAVVRRLNPFHRIKATRFTVSPLTVDKEGRILFNVLETGDLAQDFFAVDAVDSWLVRVSPNDSIEMVSYKTLVPNAPRADDLCEAPFGSPGDGALMPWPPSPDAVAPTAPCGTQRVALNVAPAIARDGTIYSATKAHFQDRYAFLVAIHPDLTPKWAASFRGLLNDGCNVPVSEGGLIPPNGAPGGCRAGAHKGVDPQTNSRPSGRILDDSSATPSVAPDGSIFFGVYTRYNYAQGHLMHFDADGHFLGAFPFGWDTTAGILRHDNTYSLVLKENHYSELGPFCDVEEFCPSDRDTTNPASPTEFFVSQLKPDFKAEWRFKNTNTNSCTRNPDGSISCVSDHPDSFEFCVNAVIIDANGLVYANSEDGNLYVIKQGGKLDSSIFQQLTIGAAYTPSSLGPDGKIYTQNAGHLFVVSGPKRNQKEHERDNDQDD
ncbi:MAG: hypothetical protein LAO78_13155 [Acidobacteriia bacterium]|nr:hypothetical protein [Terriglobia bacterium]